MLTVDTHQIVYKNPDYYCGPGPSVVCDPGSGTLALVFRRVKSWLTDGLAGHWHPGTETCLTTSHDLGKTWSPPRTILAGWQCPCLTRLSDGTLLHSSHRFEIVSPEIMSKYGETIGLMTDPWPGLHAGTAIHRSEDGGISWSEPTWLNGGAEQAPIHPSLHTPVAVRGNILQRSNGDLLISAYTLGTENISLLYISRDQGRTWCFQNRIAEGFNETYLHETQDGTLIAWMRATGDRSSNLYVTRSGDRGTQWSDPEIAFQGYPGCAANFGSGNLLVAYGYRFDEMGVRAKLYDESAHTERGHVTIQDDGAVTDLGYPHATTLPDGRVIVVYYINRKTEGTGKTTPRYIESCILSENE